MPRNSWLLTWHSIRRLLSCYCFGSRCNVHVWRVTILSWNFDPESNVKLWCLGTLDIGLINYWANYLTKYPNVQFNIVPLQQIFFLSFSRLSCHLDIRWTCGTNKLNRPVFQGKQKNQSGSIFLLQSLISDPFPDCQMYGASFISTDFVDFVSYPTFVIWN